MSRSMETGRALDVEDLIGEVRRRPVLYDSRHAKYRDREATCDSWREIGQLLGVDVSVCKLKWYKLRSSYLRETRSRANKSRISKLHNGGSSKPYYDLMDFLTEGSERHNDDDRDRPDDVDDDLVKQEVEMKYDASTTIADVIPKPTAEVMEATESGGNAMEDDSEADRHFLLSLLPLFRRLSPEDSLDVRIQIQSILKTKLFPSHS